MTATLPKINPRVTVENGWAVRNNDDGSQVRARLIHDPYHPEPERGPGMWNSGVTLVRERDGYNGMALDEHKGLARVLDRLYVDRKRDTHVWVDRPWHVEDMRLSIGREDFVRRYLRAFHGVQHASLRHHSGHSQSDWADIWVIVEGVEEGANVDALADATWSEWDAWAKGDVYMVESQTRTLTDAMCADPRDPDDGWQDGEHVGGYYGDEGAIAGLAEFLDVDEADVPEPYDVTVELY